VSYRNRLFVASAIALLHVAGAVAQQAPAKTETTLPTVTALTMMSTSVPSSDIDRSIAFYTKGLGMTVRGRVEMGAVTEVPLLFPGGGPNLMLLKPKADGAALPIRGSLSRVILMVPDLKALEAQLKSAGYQLKGPINEMKQYKVSVAHIEDPDGNHIELIQRL